MAKQNINIKEIKAGKTIWIVNMASHTLTPERVSVLSRPFKDGISTWVLTNGRYYWNKTDKQSLVDLGIIDGYGRNYGRFAFKNFRLANSFCKEMQDSSMHKLYLQKEDERLEEISFWDDYAFYEDYPVDLDLDKQVEKIYKSIIQSFKQRNIRQTYFWDAKPTKDYIFQDVNALIETENPNYYWLASKVDSNRLRIDGYYVVSEDKVYHGSIEETQIPFSFNLISEKAYFTFHKGRWFEGWDNVFNKEGFDPSKYKESEYQGFNRLLIANTPN